MHYHLLVLAAITAKAHKVAEQVLIKLAFLNQDEVLTSQLASLRVYPNRLRGSYRV